MTKEAARGDEEEVECWGRQERGREREEVAKDEACAHTHTSATRQTDRQSERTGKVFENDKMHQMLPAGIGKPPEFVVFIHQQVVFSFHCSKPCCTARVCGLPLCFPLTLEALLHCPCVWLLPTPPPPPRNRRPSSVLSGAFLPTKTAIHSLHNRLFRNYKDWCESMRIAPCFMPYPPANDDEYGGRGGSEKLEVRAFVRGRSQQAGGMQDRRPFPIS